jgi:hypothetical protein
MVVHRCKNMYQTVGNHHHIQLPRRIELGDGEGRTEGDLRDPRRNREWAVQSRPTRPGRSLSGNMMTEYIQIRGHLLDVQPL